MRKVVLFIATSLDGFIAGHDGNVEWLYTDGDFGYQDFYKSIDTTLMGYNTYEFVRNYGPFPYPEKTNYVFTRSSRLDNNNAVQFITDDISDFVRDIKSKKGKNIWLVGGAKVNSILLNNNLIDQMIISVHPIALGQGIPLFSDHTIREHKFKLIKHKLFSRSLLQLTYERVD